MYIGGFTPMVDGHTKHKLKHTVMLMNIRISSERFGVSHLVIRCLACEMPICIGMTGNMASVYYACNVLVNHFISANCLLIIPLITA
jgi:hypothetical protein